MENAIHRRNANSNEKRLKSLRTAATKLETTPQEYWLINEDLANQIIDYYHTFDQLLNDRDGLALKRSEANRKRVAKRQEARMLENHFLTSMHQAVDRGMLEPENRVYFKISSEEKQTTVPNNDDAVLHWGKALKDGEAERRADRMLELPFPTIDEVDEKLEVFRKARLDALRISGAYKRKQREVVEMVTTLIDFIPYFWGRIEGELRKKPASTRRDIAREWGVQYVSVANHAVEEELPNRMNPSNPGADEETTV